MFGVDPLVPAYGQDYKSKKELLKAWDAIKDFETAFGQYTSQAELATSGFKNIRVRYDNRQKTVVIPVKG